MPDIARLNVFISSTSSDLKVHRAEARDIVLALGFHPIMMEYFPAMDANAVKACMDKVDEADIYVGIFAHRYGFCPQGSDISITEMEFNRATQRGIPRLCFLVDENADWLAEIEGEPGQSKLRAFKHRLDQTLVRATFDTPDSLAAEVSIALQAFKSPSTRPTKQGWRVGRILVSLLFLIAIAIALVLQTNQTPQVAVAYEFLVDTSAQMREPLNGVPRYNIVTDAIDAIVSAPGSGTSRVWRGLRLAGGGCDRTELVSNGTQLSVGEFMQPLRNLQPDGNNAYARGISATFDDMALPEPSMSDVRIVFIFLGSIDPLPCSPDLEIAVTLFNYRKQGISTALCTFTMLDDENFASFREEMEEQGFGCVHNSDDAEEIGKIAIGVIQRQIGLAINEQEITPIIPPSPAIVLASATPSPSQTATTAIPIIPSPTATATSVPPTAQPDQPIEARGGPGQHYPIIATIVPDQPLNAVGISEDGNWVQIILPNGTPGWLSVSGQGVSGLGISGDLPIVPISSSTPTATPTPTPSPTATPYFVLSLGDSVQGIIEGITSEERYAFEGQTGDIIDIQMNNMSGDLDPLLILLNLDGQEIIRNDDDPTGFNRDSYIHNFTLPQSGRYTIVATRFQQALGTSEGEFSLTLAEGNAISPIPQTGDTIAYGDTVTGNIQGTTSEVRYTFTAQAGDVVEIRMNTISGDLDPLLMLIGSNGQEVVRDDDGGGSRNAYIRNLRLPTSGVYTIVATRFQEAEGTTEGAFSLILSKDGASTPIAATTLMATNTPTVALTPSVEIASLSTPAESICPAIVEEALARVETNCTGMARNEACYGSAPVQAEYQEGVTETVFENPGDRLSISDLQALRVGKINLSTNEWGIVVLNLQVNLPNVLPGQAVTVLLIGNVAIESDSESTPLSTTQFGPIQAFYFIAGFDSPQCQSLPSPISVLVGQETVVMDLTEDEVSFSSP